MGGSLVSFMPLRDLPEIVGGQALAPLILEALRRNGAALEQGDVLVVAQKVVSKAEQRWVQLAQIEPSPRAMELAAVTNKDARFVEVVLRESTAVVRAARNVLIVRHRCGHVMANAGIDRSNVALVAADDRVLLLPEDADRSARTLRAALEAASGVRLGVIVSDSFGRPWRNGVVNVALGVAGLPAMRDLRGQRDRAGRVLETTQVATADAVAAGAGLAMGEAAEGTPVVIARGLDWTPDQGTGQTLLRPLDEDLFR
jgi:coenzyme F420-0:L-glutamate ligase / coenzyme F420-1:gamma-L-glutamate ligase